MVTGKGLARRARYSVTAAVATLGAAALVGCQVLPPAVVQAAVGPAFGPAFGVDLTPLNLVQPQVADWSFHRISGASLRARREAYFSTLAYPSASAGWSVGPTAGLPLTNFGCTAADFSPNGAAAAYRTSPSDPLYNKLFFLTKNGKLVKVDRATPGSFARWDAPAGKTFSRTYVTMSPRGSRAYCYSDDGLVYVVNTVTMATAAVIAVAGGGYGIAPWIDPGLSRHDDQLDILFVASNTGAVHKYTVTGTANGTVEAVSAATSYNLATGITPLYGGTRKIAASPIVYFGRIFIGDMAGNFYDFDPAVGSSVTFPLGEPVVTSPALEIQDGYALNDPSGAPKSVAPGAPVYAFVAAGSGCAWLNLHDHTIAKSMQLRIDDNATTQFGFLKAYSFSTAGTTEYLAAQDGGVINTESPDKNLPGTALATIWRNDFLTPAETNTGDDGATPANATGGPIIGYIRWASSVARAATAIINRATLTLTPSADQVCRVPEVRTTEPSFRNTTTSWISNALTNGNRPYIGSANVGIYASGGLTAVPVVDGILGGGASTSSGNVSYRSNQSYVWDVSGAISNPSADGRYALALKYNAGGNVVLWPDGPLGASPGEKAMSPNQVEAVKFRNNALNVNPTAATSTDTRPLLTLVISNTAMPTASIETPPVIDTLTKKVYVYYTNALYELDFSSTIAFTDGDAATNYTKYNRAWHGVMANNAAGVGGTRPGGTYNNKSRFVGNYTAPLPAPNLSSMYVLSRSPTTDGSAPTTWNYALSKISLPLSSTVNRLVASSPTYTAIAGQAALTGTATDKEAAGYLATDPYTGAKKVYFALANGRIYQYDP